MMLFLSSSLSTLKKISGALMYRSIYISLCCLTVSLASGQDFYTAAKPSGNDRTFGIGGQLTYPAAGVSGRFNIGQHAAVQGIFGFIAIGNFSISSLMVRGIYRFPGNEDDDAEPYLYAGAGYWSFSEEYIDFWTARPVKRTAEFPSFGAGAGVEYVHERIPNAAANIEIGYMSMKNTSVSFQFSSITFGAGLHYYFLR